MIELFSRPTLLHRLADGARFLLGIAVLLAAEAIGDLAVDRFALPMPGALVGMMLMLAAFVAVGRVPRPIALAAGGLPRHLVLFLMPVVAGVLDHLDLLQGNWLPFLAACLLGTALTLAATAALLQQLLRGDAIPPDGERG